MARYSAQLRNVILKKMLPPEERPATELAKKYGISVTTLYGWKARLKSGTLMTEEGMQSNQQRSLGEKLSLLLESKHIPPEEVGSWLREQGLHSEHLTVWEQELRDVVVKRETEAKEGLKELKKQLKAQEKELLRKEKALAELAAIITLQKKTAQLLQGPGDD